MSETPAPASRFSDAELAAIDQALMTVPFPLRARVLARVAETDQIAAQLSKNEQEPEGKTISRVETGDADSDVPSTR